eukprot:m51a1_g13850 putative uracil-dna glycosylase (591) ;mRNA; r:570529-572604
MTHSAFESQLFDGFAALEKKSSTALDSVDALATLLRTVSEALGAGLAKAESAVAKFGLKTSLFDGSVKARPPPDAADTLAGGLELLVTKQKPMVQQMLDLAKDAEAYVKDRTRTRQKMLSETRALTDNWASEYASLNKAKDSYHKRLRESHDARRQLAQVEERQKLSSLRVYQQKARQAHEKLQVAETRYRDRLASANSLLRKIYECEAPRLLRDFQEFEQSRVLLCRQSIGQLSLRIAELPEVIGSIHASLAKAYECVRVDDDVDMLAALFRTYVYAPEDIKFDEGPAYTYTNPCMSPLQGVKRVASLQRFMASSPSLSPGPVRKAPVRPPPGTPDMSSKTRRFSIMCKEQLAFAGTIETPPHGFVPEGSCKEVVLAAAPVLAQRVPLLTEIVAACETVCKSVCETGEAAELIRRHGLTNDEVLAVVLYTYDTGLLGKPSSDGNFYFQLNEVLRLRNSAEMRALQGYLYYFNSALRKLPDYKGVVYRGNSAVDIVRSEYSMGREIYWSSYSSATISEVVAKAFAGEDGMIFRVHISTGKVISSFSAVQAECEVLLPPNAGLVVSRELHLDDNGCGPYVDLVERIGKFCW